MVRIAVLDDNEQSRKELCDVLTRQPGEYQVESFASSKDLMAAGSFDIAFVDVVMKQESGIDAAREIAAEQPGCKIIFCTSFPEYAPDIYAVRHTCLVTKNRLEELVPLALRRAQAEDMEYKPKLLMIRQRSSTEIVEEAQILYIERSGRVSHVHTDDGRELQSADKLNLFLEKVTPDTFGRCHVSYIVNFSHVEHLGRDSVRLKSGAMLPVSRAYAKSFRRQLGEYIAQHSMNEALV